MNTLCIKCKGKGECGREYCPHILKSQAVFKIKHTLFKSEFSSASPAPFVGRIGYPNVNLGILAPVEKTKDTYLYDAPRKWAKDNYQIPKIVEFRSSLINSRAITNVKKTSKMLQINQEIAMASKPVDLDISLEDKPRFHLNTQDVLAPTGPNASLLKADVTSNPKIARKVDRVFSDTDLLAVDGLTYLYDNNFDENFLTKILSVGTLGMKKNRKLVPSRWSITAVDDTLGKHLHKKILDNTKLDEHLAFFSGYLGNYYLVMMFPGCYSYELFECYMPKASWNTKDSLDFSTDHEFYQGRKTYAGNCAGGYYSVRLAVLEKLKEMKRQATTVVMRVITGEYSSPLGVWVTREASRKSLETKPLRFGSIELLLAYASSLVKKKFGQDINSILDKSVLIRNIKTQRRLFDY